MRRLAFAAALFLLILLPLSAESFIMDRYSVSIDVDSSRTLHYEEDMALDFIYPSHGIIRDIQYIFPGYDGYPRTRADVSDIKADRPMDVSRGSGYVHLRLGDPDALITGKQSFAISYDYALGKDYYDDYDELYINIVSADGWDTVIRDVEFSVTFPYPVDAGRIWVTYGPYGSLERLPFTLSDDGMTVRGSASGLAPGEAVTLRVEMDEGYFADARSPYSSLYLIFSCGAAATVLILSFIIFLYFRYGRDEKLAVPVEFHPPAGITPMDISYISSGSIGDDAVGAMLFYWADQGYVKIDEAARGEYTFSVLMWPTEMEKREESLFSSFFTSPVVDGKTLRISGFPSKIRRVVLPAEHAYFSGSRSLFDSNSLKARRLASIASGALAIIHAIVSGLLSGMSLFAPCLILSFMAFVSSRTLSSARKLVLPAVAFMAFFMFFIGFGYFSILSSAIPSMLAAAEAGLFILSLFSASIATSFIYRKSKYGNEITGRIEGFREFIDKTEKDKLEKLSEEDPRYFYHVLSYAMVFGLADKWCDKFRGIAVEDVPWYKPYGGVGDIMAYAYFSRAWRSMYRRDVMPRSSGSGGGRPTFSGFSGHAGGGFSGGGGRSW